MKLNWRILFALTLLAAEVASAATLNVTSIADSGPGTLRDALARAADGDRINATRVHGTIRLTSGELFIGKSVAIVGPGPARLAVDGDLSGRVFYIGSSVVVRLTGLTITNGAAPYQIGGGIYNDHAILTVSNCVVSGNYADGGAGIVNDGSFGNATLTVVNSFVTGNLVLVESFSGGGILNFGENGSATLTVVNSTVSDNSAGLLGGGIFNDAYEGNAIVTLVESTVSDNDAGGSGGGIYNAGWNGMASLTLENSTVTGNQAGSGAGIYNAAYGDGGTALLSVVNCAIIGNHCLYYGVGGGLYNSGSALMTLANSTVSGNLAATGGGIYNSHYNNSGPAGGAGNAFLQILNCTLSDNSAETIYNADCSSTMQIGSTILNASASGSTFGFGCSFANDSVTSLGYNISSDDAGGVLIAATDLINTDPQLGPLRDNGGRTFTHALLPGSPAIDQGKIFSNSPFDQRGHRFARTFDNRFVPNAPGGDGTDIGAFEVQTISQGHGPRHTTVPRGFLDAR